MSVEPDAAGPDAGDSTVRDTAATGTALVRVVPQPQAASPRRAKPRLALWGAGMAVALGLGTVGVRVVQLSGAPPVPGAALVQADASTQALRRLQDEVARLNGSVESLRASAEAARQDEPMRGLRRSVDALNQEIDQVRSSNWSTLAQLSTRIEKADHDPAPKLAEILTRLDRLDREPGAKLPDAAAQRLADVQNRLERIERQVSSPAVTGSIPSASHPAASEPTPVPAPTPGSVGKAGFASTQAVPHPGAASVTSPVAATVASTASAARTTVARADPVPVKPVAAAAWVLRDVYDGLALVEARGGTLREIAPGEYLPGMGEVRSIERRGRNWVVLTSRGAIE